jgi:hypothetical protein
VKRRRFGPAFWGLCYLALTPTFGLVYFSLPPRSFHQPLLRLEQQYAGRDADAVRSHVTAAIGRVHPVSEEALSGRCPPVHLENEVRRVTVREEGQLVILINTTAQIMPGSIRTSSTSVVLKGLNRASEEVRLLGSLEVLNYFELDRENPSSIDQQDFRCDEDGTLRGSVLSVQNIFPITVPFEQTRKSGTNKFTRVWRLDTNSNAGAIRLTQPETAALRRFVLAAGGDPKSASGAFLRMLYLSAVTATTLGYGDITPITTTARVAVGAEAILGVAFAGLFLSALAQRLKRPTER